MKLTEHLQSNLVKVPLDAVDKAQAITELVDLVAAHGLTTNRDVLHKAVMDREAQRSTGIGRGFAIPHAKTDAVSKLIITIGRCNEPIDFSAIDAQPVSLIALLASPTNATSAHIQALAKLSRLVTNQATLTRLLEAESAQDLYNVIAQSDSEG